MIVSKIDRNVSISRLFIEFVDNFQLCLKIIVRKLSFKLPTYKGFLDFVYEFQ